MTSSDSCAHRFARRRWWWLVRNSGPRDRWSCVLCGFGTRTYDALDRIAGRPVHPHMSVAYPGANTVGRVSA